MKGKFMSQYKDISERFIRYASITTQSEEGHVETPSTECQRDLASLLTSELEEMGASNVVYDEKYCYVYATIPGNIPVDEKKLNARADKDTKHRENLAPILGLMAHMDTSDAVKGLKVSPRLIRNYDGSDIVLDAEGRYVLSLSDYPSLSAHKGDDLIVTDGTSVLGADDKAGVAAIMEMAEFFLNHPEYAHGTIRICFTPDEEVGNGPKNLNTDIFACDYAYTVDGGDLGELQYENFNAADAKIAFRGISTHPGEAYGRMRNAILVAADFISMLPAMEIPSRTRGYEGFFHVEGFTGTTDEAHMDVIIRDHDRKRFEERKKTISKITDTLNERYGRDSVTAEVKDSYYNMREKIEPHMELVENARKAMESLGIKPIISPIRGGTDGCVLSFRGIPCPNLGTGGYNYHSRYEYASVSEMKKNVRLLAKIMNLYAEYELDD
jgi:tripeptide aminopeptidase